MAQEVYDLPEGTASRVMQAVAQIQRIEQAAVAEIQSVQRRQQEVIATFFEVRGITLDERAAVNLDVDEETGAVRVVVVTPESPQDSGPDGVSVSAEEPRKSRKRTPAKA